MQGMSCADKFRSEAVKQITERGHSVADVAKKSGDFDQESLQVAARVCRA